MEKSDIFSGREKLLGMLFSDSNDKEQPVKTGSLLWTLTTDTYKLALLSVNDRVVPA